MDDFIWWHRIRLHRVRKSESMINPIAVRWYCETCKCFWRGSLI